VFSIGATGYFSLPIYAPADKGGNWPIPLL
jgi:hypothetical protein